MKKNFKLFVVVVLLISVVMALVGCSGSNKKPPMSELDGPEPWYDNTSSVKEVDPFANVVLNTRGVSGSGSVSDYLEYTIFVDDEIGELYFELIVDTSKNGTLSNGDTVHATVRDSYNGYYDQFCDVKLTRTEADVVLNDFAEYAHKNPSDVIKYLGGESLDCAMMALEEWMNGVGECTREDYGEMMAKYVGAAYYYQDEGNPLSSDENEYNQLVLIYNINDGVVPGGWYVYLALGDNVAVGYRDGSPVVLRDTGHWFDERLQFYYQELYVPGYEYNHPIAFEYNETTYVGHRTIEDCIEAYEKNVLRVENRIYDHVIYSDGIPAGGSVG